VTDGLLFSISNYKSNSIYLFANKLRLTRKGTIIAFPVPRQQDNDFFTYRHNSKTR